MRVRDVLAAVALIGLIGVVVPLTAAAQAKKPTVMAHAADGRADCLSCHATKTDSTKAVPEDHANRPNESCLLCHDKDAMVQTKDSPGFKHTAQGRTNCLMCHNGKMKAPVAPVESHKGMTDSKFCGYCHKQIPAAPAP